MVRSTAKDSLTKPPLHTINQMYAAGFFMNYFRMDDLKKKILHMALLFAGALLVGIGAAVATEYMQTDAEQKVRAPHRADEPHLESCEPEDVRDVQEQTRQTSGQKYAELSEQGYMKIQSESTGSTALQTHWEREEKISMQTEVSDESALENRTRQDEQIKKVALTFDDGPNPEYTGMLLDGLKERGVKATFFVLGSEVELYPQLVRRASEEGHLIGVHAYRHVNLRQLSDGQAIEQIDRTNGAIYRATGQYASYIRPPYGCWKEDLDYEVQMVEVLWDIDPRDWATTSSDLVVQRVLKEVEESSIILLHDASKSSVQAAFTIIDTLQEQGYTFVTVEELILE